MNQEDIDLNDNDVVVVSGVRTAVGSFGGALKDVSVVKLGSLVIKEVLKKAGLRPKSSAKLLDVGPDALKGEACEVEQKACDWDSSLKEVQVDEVIMGCVLQGGQGQNVARQAMIYAGVPKETTASTINFVCGSGLKSVILAAQAVKCGDAEIVIAGGMESMSNAPFALSKARWGYRMSVTAKDEIYDLTVYDGLWEIFGGYHMGITAENIAAKYKISREEQDKIGLLSHQRARAAITAGKFKEEIVPVVIPQRKGDPIVFDTDERPMDTTLEKMAKLAPAFKKDGTVTAGNASGINDAAAAVLVMSRAKAKELGLKPMVTIKSYASGGIDPAYMGLGPIPSSRKALQNAGLTVKDLDVIELNEAFASQVIASMRELGLSIENTNPNGSGISLGHPIGASGTRMLVSAMHEMKNENWNKALLTMCIGGGQGIAMVVEK
ncbi:MAG: acetyl-CoA C-acetyltransferase [Dehalococcoidales bacterium]|nr:acetyl-CoA C-acetyltransferase [Dehalococcoidales bacterium]